MLATRKGAVELLTASIKESIADELQQIEGIRSVAGELVDLVTLGPGQVVLITGWAPQSYLWNSLELLDGTLPDPDASGEVVVGQACSEALGIIPGKTIRIRGSDFIVSGIFRQRGVMGNGTIVLPLSTMQSVLERPGTVTEFNILVEHPDDREWVSDLRTRLNETFPYLLFMETSEITNNNDVLRLFRAMAWGTSFLALVIALVVVLNTLLMTVTERTREIGILSAVGWSSSRILTMIILEGIILAVIGSIVGSILGTCGLRYLAHLPYVRGFLHPVVTVRLLLEVFCATLMLGVLGSLYPAYRAVHINPVDALMYE
jgi:putative ABC transport system permease protein